MNAEQIAAVCHAANREMTKYILDVPIQPEWEDAPEEMRRSSVAGVRWRMSNLGASNAAQHDEWCRAKVADGWVYGDKKDAGKKTHPALVPYEKLALATKLKDAVFVGIVMALVGSDD